MVTITTSTATTAAPKSDTSTTSFTDTTMLDTAPDLKTLSCKQLRELVGEPQQQLEERTQEEMEVARQQLQLLADQIGTRAAMGAA